MNTVDVPIAVRGPVGRLYRDHPSELLISGPRGTGKDVGIGLYLRTMCEDYPGARIHVMRKTRRSLTESWLVTWEDHVLTEGDPMLNGARRMNRHSYDHPNGSTVVLGGMDEPMKLYSSEWDIVYVQEANELSFDEWEQIKGVLRHFTVPWQQLIGSCNPGAPSHWLYKRCCDGLCQHWVTHHTHNPAYYDRTGHLTDNGRQYMTTLSELTGTRRKRLFKGLWVASEGQVYDRWDRSVHMVKRDGPWKRIVVGVDDGYTNPFAVVRCCFDEDGRCHVEAERYERGLDSRAKTATVRSLAEGAEQIVVDSAASTVIADLRSAGLPAVGVAKGKAPADADGKEKSWLLQTINKVQTRLVNAGDGRPRLTIDPFCVNTAAEFEAYERKLVDGVYTDQPEDVDNHALDALRYVIATVDPDVGQAAIYTSSVPPVPLTAEEKAMNPFDLRRRRVPVLEDPTFH